MATIRFDVDDRAIAQVIRKLDKLGKLEQHMAKPMEEATQLIHKTIKPYPPEPPQSTYRRTNTLGRRWQRSQRSIPNGFEGRVFNDTEYAMWVQGGSTQTAVHRRTGWKTTDVVADETRTQVEHILDKAVEAIVEGR